MNQHTCKDAFPVGEHTAHNINFSCYFCFCGKFIVHTDTAFYQDSIFRLQNRVALKNKNKSRLILIEELYTYYTEEIKKRILNKSKTNFKNK